VIFVVSGLPRSGTSLMMQMLAAGGMPVLTDGERKADTDNPRGYCEWERIKLLAQEPQCIAEAEGKVVKVISQLLFALPPAFQYKIVFMVRPLPEVVASQSEMIRRLGTAGPAIPEAVMMASLQAHLNQVRAWLKNKPNLTVLDVEYHSVLRDPFGAARTIADFISIQLDAGKMAQQVDPQLFRNRVAVTAELQQLLS